MPNIKSNASVLGQMLFSPSLLGTENTAELALMAAGSGNDETAIDIKLQRSLKTPSFPHYPFYVGPLTTLQLHWHESSTTEQRVVP